MYFGSSRGIAVLEQKVSEQTLERFDNKSKSF